MHSLLFKNKLHVSISVDLIECNGIPTIAIVSLDPIIKWKLQEV